MSKEKKNIVSGGLLLQTPCSPRPKWPSYCLIDVIQIFSVLFAFIVGSSPTSVKIIAILCYFYHLLVYFSVVL